jgi:hypothetical protein
MRKDIQDKLEKLGVSVISDERVMKRIELFQDFHKAIEECTMLPPELPPEEKVDKMAEYIHIINDMLHSMAIPWGRAGDENWYSQMMSGWSTIHTRTLDLIGTVKNLMKRLENEKAKTNDKAPYIQKEELVRKLKSFIETFYLKYALLIAEVSWMSRDVAPSWSVTLQQPQVMPYGMPPLTTIDRGSFGGGGQQPPPEELNPPQQDLIRRRRGES